MNNTAVNNQNPASPVNTPGRIIAAIAVTLCVAILGIGSGAMFGMTLELTFGDPDAFLAGIAGLFYGAAAGAIIGLIGGGVVSKKAGLVSSTGATLVAGLPLAFGLVALSGVV